MQISSKIFTYLEKAKELDNSTRVKLSKFSDFEGINRG